MKDLPKAAAEAIRETAEGDSVKQIEKSKIRAEIKKEGESGKVVRLASPKYIYEAEIAKGSETGEIQVGADGTVIESRNWHTRGLKEEN